jgi:hypothetical protein
MKQINHIAVFIFTSLLLLTVFAHADTKKSGIDILNESYDYQGSLDRYTVASKVVFEITEDGETYEDIRIIRAKIDRPNKVRIDKSGDTVDRSVYISDGTFTILDNTEQYYTQVNTADNIDEALDQIVEELGIVIPVATLLHSDMSTHIQPKKVTYFGKKTVAGVECNYIAFKRHGNEVHLWIEDSDSPLVKQVAVFGKDFKMEMATNWDTNPKFLDNVFEFQPSKDASKISIVAAK